MAMSAKKRLRDQVAAEDSIGQLSPVAPIITDTPGGLRRRAYLRSVYFYVDMLCSNYTRASQSDRITVLVGDTKEPFQVPRGLLAQYSEPLGRMCSAGFKESTTGIIHLPEVEIPVFEDFLIWLLAFEPGIDASKSIDTLVDLAIFGEIYLIYHLKNQTSDAIRAIIAADDWEPTPEMVTRIYESVPAGSILRRLCLYGFAIRPCYNDGYGKSLGASMRKYQKFSEWKSVFQTSLDFGWDYFRYSQSGSQDVLDIKAGGSCRFHDHSDHIGRNGAVQERCLFSSSWSDVVRRKRMPIVDGSLTENTPSELNGPQVDGDKGLGE